MQVMALTLNVSRLLGCMASAVTFASVHVLLLSVQPHSMLTSAPWGYALHGVQGSNHCDLGRPCQL